MVGALLPPRVGGAPSSVHPSGDFGGPPRRAATIPCDEERSGLVGGCSGMGAVSSCRGHRGLRPVFTTLGAYRTSMLYHVLTALIMSGAQVRRSRCLEACCLVVTDVSLTGVVEHCLDGIEP